MKSPLPYLTRAMLEWIIDSGSTPYLIVDARVHKVQLPPELIVDGEAVLDLSPEVTDNLVITQDHLMYISLYLGEPEYDIVVPIVAVAGIVAKENGQGMWFTSDIVMRDMVAREKGQGMWFSGDDPEPPPGKPAPKTGKKTGQKSGKKTGKKNSSPPNLRIVK